MKHWHPDKKWMANYIKKWSPPKDIKKLRALAYVTKNMSGRTGVAYCDVGSIAASDPLNATIDEEQWKQARRDLGLERACVPDQVWKLEDKLIKERTMSNVRWSEWIENSGAEPKYSVVKVKSKDGHTDQGHPSFYRWRIDGYDDDIEAYRYKIKEGIEWPEVTEAEEEAWQDKERQLIGVRNKYQREIKPGIWVDVYDVLQAWSVVNPALQHLIKKSLQPGERGHKDKAQDMDDIVASSLRAKELESK